MKTYKALNKDLLNIYNTISDLEKAERAMREKDYISCKVDQEYIDLCNKLEESKIMLQVLRDNYTYSLGVAGLKALAEITAKYDGKSCGEMTERTISNEMKKRGFYVYFNRDFYWHSGKECSHITIHSIERMHNDPASIYPQVITDADGKTRRVIFIDDSNKINHSAIVAGVVSGNYTDSPAKRVKQIKRAYAKYTAAIRTAAELQAEYNNLLPLNMNHKNNVNEYVHMF